MADTKAKITLTGDTAIELDVLKGTLGQDVIDIRSLGSKGVFTFDPGFTSTASCESKITFIDGDEGILLHRGFPIDQLATDSNYLKSVTSCCTAKNRRRKSMTSSERQSPAIR